jgi:hypothetical protein
MKGLITLKANKIYPEIHNYENAINDELFLILRTHMNDTGARLFTAKL